MFDTVNTFDLALRRIMVFLASTSGAPYYRIWAIALSVPETQATRALFHTNEVVNWGTGPPKVDKVDSFEEFIVKGADGDYKVSAPPGLDGKINVEGDTQVGEYFVPR